MQSFQCDSKSTVVPHELLLKSTLQSLQKSQLERRASELVEELHTHISLCERHETM